MGKKVEFNPKQRAEIGNALKSAKSKEEYQRALCLCLRVEEGLGAKQIAKILGMSFGGVRNIHSKYLRRGGLILKNAPIGGRLHANLSLVEEKEFLAPFEKKAEKCGILVVSEIHRAYEKHFGTKEPASTIYRLLARQGWRKVAPRPSHPKADLSAQEAFKKTFQTSCLSSKRWTKSL